MTDFMKIAREYCETCERSERTFCTIRDEGIAKPANMMELRSLLKNSKKVLAELMVREKISRPKQAEWLRNFWLAMKTEGPSFNWMIRCKWLQMQHDKEHEVGDHGT